jgi:thioredoxin 1
LRLMPQVETLAERLGDRIRVAKVDSSANRRLCIRLKVLSLPTFLTFRDGAEVRRLTGETLSIREIEAAANELLGEGK